MLTSHTYWTWWTQHNFWPSLATPLPSVSLLSPPYPTRREAWMFCILFIYFFLPLPLPDTQEDHRWLFNVGAPRTGSPGTLLPSDYPHSASSNSSEILFKCSCPRAAAAAILLQVSTPLWLSLSPKASSLQILQCLVSLLWWGQTKVLILSFCLVVKMTSKLFACWWQKKINK